MGQDTAKSFSKEREEGDLALCRCSIHGVIYPKDFPCPVCYLYELGYEMEIVDGEGRYTHYLPGIK